MATPAQTPGATSSSSTFGLAHKSRGSFLAAWGRVLLVLCISGSLGCACVWPVLAAGSLLPVVSVVSLPALLATSFALFHFLPATLRLALAEPQPRLLPPFHLFHPRQNFRIWVSFTCILLDLHRSRLLTHFLEDLTKKVLLLRKTGSVPTCRANIVFVPADLDTGQPARRLDVYLTEENDATGEDKENVPLAQVIILLAFPSYRLAGSRGFPASAIAAQLRSTLDVCVVVPSLTPFTRDAPEGEALERMVGETRECVKWVGENIARYGGDSEQIWLMGFGAGAHIASLAMVQSAVVAAREGYFAQRADHETTRVNKEGLVSVDDGSSSSVLDALSPRHSGAAPSSNAPVIGGEEGMRAGGAHAADSPFSPSRRRQRSTSSDLARKSPSTSFERSSSTVEDIQEGDDDEVERLLRQSRLARLEKLEAEALPAWSEPPNDVEPSIASGAAALVSSGGRSFDMTARETDFDKDDDLGEPDSELSISDGIKSCRLFTLDSILSTRLAAQEHARSSGLRAPEEEQDLFVPDPSLYRHEPEFGFDSRQVCSSLATFDMPSIRSERKKPQREQSKRVEVKGMILVEGTYDIVKQGKWDADRGVDQVSSLMRLCDAPHRDFLHACPSHLLYAASPLLSAPDLASQGIESCHEIGVPVSRRLLPTKVLLIHGGADLLSPFSPAILFRNLLIGVGLESDDVKVKLYRHLTGFGALSALMGHGSYVSILYDEIAEILELDEEGTEDEQECVEAARQRS